MSNKGNRLVGKRIADRYSITGEIGKGGMGVVYKAIPFDDPSHSVAIKVIQRSGKLGYDDLMRFQKEASLMSQLHHPNIVVFHELGLFGREHDDEELGSGYYIVMEIADGTNLKESLARDGRKDLAYFFQVGLQVSTALDYTHGKNIIHRDIKPHNIIVGQAWRDQRGVMVKVLDFGVARLAEAMHYTGAAAGAPGGKEAGGAKAFEEAAGTPLYMAPEQTPLMDAPVDHRVDLYSLGCVLYELLAGKPPFTANSREKLEKQHVFADPEPLTHLRPDIPPLVEKIVHKLLAKHPNDRYQTAFALHADLMRAKTMFEKAGRPAGISFPLGLKDRFQAVSAQLKLIGRDQEVATLIGEYDGVATQKGRSRLTIVKGAAGIGKSRLMAEFQAYLARRKVRFISGQFSQHENALPFNALANAFNEYLHRVLKSHPHEAEELRRRVKHLLGSMAHRIAEIVPGLKPYLVDIPEEVAEGEGAEAAPGDVITNEAVFATFAKAFSDFTKCLGTDNQPIVFLFHDLHWADEKSLDLIDTFFTNANTLQFYLVVSQRSGLHVQNERFNQFIEKFRKLRRRFQEIELDRIGKEAITGIVGNMLSSPESATEPLVAYLEEQSKGNPMHLVELTRTLVARDLIAPKASSSEWEFDIKALRKTQIQLNTIDLILSRIQEYQEFDRQVLGIAATVGLTFQFEVLLLGGRSQSVPVMKAVQRAMDEGLVVRVTDDPDLKHLGKTFMFAHKKARDAIYEGIGDGGGANRRELHKLIGEKLEAAIPEPSEKILFALAHHFNSALDHGTTEDQGLAQRVLRYNNQAGYAAYKSGSWQTAERYYENSWRIMESWQDKISTLEERARVQEILADLAAIQKRHGKALKVYRELLQLKLNVSMQASIAYKAVYFQLVGGIMSDTARLIEGTLRLLRRKLPDPLFLSRLSLALSLLVDVFPGNRRKKRLHRLLGMAHARRKEDPDVIERKFPAIRLYSAGVQLHMRDRATLAMIYHNHAMKEALQGNGSASSLIRVVAERAALLGYLGQTRIAYTFLDLAMDVARACNLRTVYGYVALLRVLTIDYVKGRHEEISDHLKEAMTYLTTNEERLAHGQGLLFKIFRELTRCNFTALYRYSQRMPDTIPTRNWLSPRYVAMMLYGYLLQGSRDNIVRHGEMFLKRRQKVAGRGNDMFIKMILTLVAFAKGEIDKTREHFLLTMEDFITSHGREFLFPFEEDFAAVVAFTFPVLFEQEYGRHLMRVQEMEGLLVRLRKRITKLKGLNRAIPLLLKARSDELAGDKKMIRANYDAALKNAKVAGNNLVQVFAYLWFGTHLLDHGHGQKGDYIRRALLLAHKLELKALVQHIKKMMEKRDLPMKELALTAQQTTRDPSMHPGVLPSRLFIEHLNHVCEAAEAETTLEEDIAASFAILAKHYNAGGIYCILMTKEGTPKVVFPTEEAAHQTAVVDYIEPYFNIRSTLFLPHSDAPWVRGSAGGASTEATSDEDTTRNGVAAAGAEPDGHFDGNSTMVMGGAPQGGGAAATQLAGGGPGAADLGVSSTHRSRHPGQPADAPSGGFGGGGLAMSALVPMRSNFNSLGVIFVEDIVGTSGKDTTTWREELDQFGSQIGIMIERKTGFELTGSVQAHPQMASTLAVNAIYQPASYTIESAPWLKIWQYGKLRVQRETSWFLGLNIGPDQYLMAYCLLTGNDAVRERLGAMIWHHMYVIRALAVASGRSRIETGDLREEFEGLFHAVPKAAMLETISLAFTLFNREDRVCFSGHFGPSRPYVVGVENIVQPANDVVLTYANGRDLRYWDVGAEAQGPHAYVLSYDTSKLDAAPVDTVQKRVAESLNNAGSLEEMHRILASMVAEENLPRYYVASMFHDPREAPEDGLEQLAKAE